jgi:hypothetical protein
LEEHSEEIDSLARADRFLYEISKWVIMHDRSMFVIVVVFVCIQLYTFTFQVLF